MNCACCGDEDAAAGTAAVKQNRHSRRVQFVLCPSCNNVVTYCFYRMLQTDMQLSGIYLVNAFDAAC